MKIAGVGARSAEVSRAFPLPSEMSLASVQNGSDLGQQILKPIGFADISRGAGLQALLYRTVLVIGEY